MVDQLRYFDDTAVSRVVNTHRPRTTYEPGGCASPRYRRWRLISILALWPADPRCLVGIRDGHHKSDVRQRMFGGVTVRGVWRLVAPLELGVGDE
jgi:hypothetical protein